jgi:hypothetical protein
MNGETGFISPITRQERLNRTDWRLRSGGLVDESDCDRPRAPERFQYGLSPATEGLEVLTGRAAPH